MHINFVVLLISAIIPLLIGFIYYNPKTLGNAWMKEAEMTEEKMKNANNPHTQQKKYKIFRIL